MEVFGFECCRWRNDLVCVSLSYFFKASNCFPCETIVLSLCFEIYIFKFLTKLIVIKYKLTCFFAEIILINELSWN